MSIKIEFPHNDQKAAAIFGRALLEYAGETVAIPAQTIESVAIVASHPLNCIGDECTDVACPFDHSGVVSLSAGYSTTLETGTDAVIPDREVVTTAVTETIDEGLAKRLAETENNAAVTTTGVATETSGIDFTVLDSAGLPWDGEIHARTKTKIGDGSWKLRKRNAAVAADKSEWDSYIDGVRKMHVGMMAEVTPAVETTTTAKTLFPDTDTVVAPPVIEPPAIVAPAAQQVDIKTFPQLMSFVTENAIPTAKVTEVINRHGIAAIPLLATRPDLIPAVMVDLQALVAK